MVSVHVEVLAGAMLLYVLLFIAGMAIVSYAVSRGISRASQEYNAKREGEDRVKIIQLETKVQVLEKRLDEVTQQLLRRFDPKDEAVAP